MGMLKLLKFTWAVAGEPDLRLGSKSHKKVILFYPEHQSPRVKQIPTNSFSRGKIPVTNFALSMGGSQRTLLALTSPARPPEVLGGGIIQRVTFSVLLPQSSGCDINFPRVLLLLFTCIHTLFVFAQGLT